MTWVAMVCVGVGSYVFRVGPLLGFGRATNVDRFDRHLRYASAAAIAALITQSFHHAAGGGHLVPVLLALAATLPLAARGVSMLRIVCAGLAIYTLSIAVLNVLAR